MKKERRNNCKLRKIQKAFSWLYKLYRKQLAKVQCHTIDLENFSLLFIGVNFYKAARLDPPLFKLLGFRASEPPHFFVTCNAYYEAVFRGLPNNKVTPNDIHANQTTSFVRIQQWKLQAVSRIVLEFFSTSRCLVA